MTRKESDALLRWMRETGSSIKVDLHYEHEARPYASNTTTVFFAAADDDYVYFTHYGQWACKNTFADFWGYMKCSTLLQKGPFE